MQLDEEAHDLPRFDEHEWNIYSDDARREMVDADRIDPDEEAFMKGYLGEA